MVCNLYLTCNIFCQNNLTAARIRNFIVHAINCNHRTIEDWLIAIHFKYIVSNRLFRTIYSFCQRKIFKLPTNRTICTSGNILCLSNLYIVIAVCIGNCTCCFCSCFLKQTNGNGNTCYWICLGGICFIFFCNRFCELDIVHLCGCIFIGNGCIHFFRIQSFLFIRCFFIRNIIWIWNWEGNFIVLIRYCEFF